MAAHEVGHALGLGHVEDPASVMHPTAEGVLADSAGDRLGLRTLGVDGGPSPPDGIGRLWCGLPGA